MNEKQTIRANAADALPDVSPYAFMAPVPWRPITRTIVKKERPRLYKEINRRQYW